MSRSGERRSKLYVKTLDLLNFRNYESLSLTLDPGTNLFYGSNAQGKTNILEAIYLSGTTKSHRGAKDRDMIRIGQEEGHIRMTADRRGNEYRIDVHLKKGRGKGYAVGGVPLKRASDIFGIANIVFFSPEDLGIIKNGPSARRRFLDLLLSGTDRIYFSDLAVYVRALNQRNALLKEMQLREEERLDELSVWDEQLAASGSRIIKRRRDFISEFAVFAAEKHAFLTGGGECLGLVYEPNTEEMEFYERLKMNRHADIRLKTTTAGPHRDDIAIFANGMDLRTYGSQGQVRTAALSMKMAEIETVLAKKHEMPVLLLDDVLSELDRNRQDALLSLIENTQTLITCTGMDESVKGRLKADRVFHVKEGKAEIIRSGSTE